MRSTTKQLERLVTILNATVPGADFSINHKPYGKQNYTITLTGMRRLPNYETIQRMLREAENDSSLTIVRIARLSPGCDYTAPGEYEIGVRSNDTTYTAIIRLSNR